jgi:three-Cys-motif partner protein
VSLDDIVRRCNEDDGLFMPEIRPHSLEKIGIHNRYAELFAAAVSNRWPQRAYLGLYSGTGRARLKTTGEIVETSALSVLRQERQFTHHIFVDNNEECLSALERRVAVLGRSSDCHFILEDVNQSVGRVRAALPRYSQAKGLLSFCFVDPFDIKLKFSTIRGLSDFRMDFLVLLMLGNDARRNQRQYLDDERSTVVADFIGSPDWRREFREGNDRSILRFLGRKFDDAMVSLGYLRPTQACRIVVKPAGKNVPLYVLAFYTKAPLGQRLFTAARDSLTTQTELGI